MSKINDYVENMFYGLPNTADVIETKKSIIDSMEDKYSELLARGMSENEAFGTVASEFGNIEELARERGWSKESYSSAENGGWKFERDGKHVSVSFEDDDDDDHDYHCKDDNFTNLASSIIMGLAVIAYAVLGFFFQLWHPYWVIIPVAGMLCGVVKMLRDWAVTKRIQFAGIVMTIATAAFLVLGACFNMWHPAWLLFPVCGILSGIIESMLKVNRKKK